MAVRVFCWGAIVALSSFFSPPVVFALQSCRPILRPRRTYTTLNASPWTYSRLGLASRTQADADVDDQLDLLGVPDEIADFGSHAVPTTTLRDDGSSRQDNGLHAFDNMQSQSVWLLNLVAVLWGSQHAVIKLCVQDSDSPAGPFTLLRFGIAALLASPYTPGLQGLLLVPSQDKSVTNNITANDSTTAQTWRWGLELGFWMFLGFSFQAIGLEFTTAQKSGFLLYLNVKFVPILAWLLLGRQISVPTWISAFAAVSGTALLATSGTVDTATLAGTFNIGDAWSIAAALASAMFILRLERASELVKDAAQLNAACLWVVTLLAAAWTLVRPDETDFGSSVHGTWNQVVSLASSHTIELLYLGGVTTALANWIQTKAQRDVSAERASVIYAMDPVYGAAFSYLVLGEQFAGAQAWVGAGLIAAAAATNAYLSLPELSGGTADERAQ